MNMGSYKSLYYYLLIIQIITLCFNVSPKLNASDAPVREQKYYLKTFDTKITSKAIALVYSFATQNDIQWHSFYPTLQNLWFQRPTILLSCYRTIHLSSSDTTNRQYTICTQPLLQEMKNLSQSFNQRLLKPTKSSTSAPPNNDLNQGADEDEDPQLNNRYGNINESYQSEALEKNITDTLKSFSVPTLISHRHNYKHRTTSKHRLKNNN